MPLAPLLFPLTQITQITRITQIGFRGLERPRASGVQDTSTGAEFAGRTPQRITFR